MQLEDWELRELGPMLLPPEVLLHFGINGSSSGYNSSNSEHRRLANYVHVADLTREDMPPALFQPPPSLWEQKQLQKQQLSLSLSIDRGGALAPNNHNAHNAYNRRRVDDDFSLGDPYSDDTAKTVVKKYDRDPFAYWTSHRHEHRMGGGRRGREVAALNMQEVEARAKALDQDFDNSEETLRRLEEIVQYEEETWGVLGEEGGGRAGQEEEHRERYLRYDHAAGVRTSGAAVGARTNVDALERDVSEARELMSQLEALVGLDEEGEEGEEGWEGDEGSGGEEREAAWGKEKGRQSGHGNDGPQHMLPSGRTTMRYAGQGEWKEATSSDQTDASPVRSHRSNNAAPSPSRLVQAKQNARRQRIEARKTQSNRQSSRPSNVNGRRPTGKRYKRIPSTMTRRSREHVVHAKARRRESVGTRVHKGVTRMNQATGIHGRIDAALNLARNIV